MLLPQRMMVTLRGEAAVALQRFAERQYRDPRAQGALLIEEGLQRAGLLPGSDGERSAEADAVGVSDARA
jgi:hypothetical protein